jgi:formate dehydrogenase subunit gamma
MPVRLAWQIAITIVLLFVAGYVIHWLRRSFRPWPTPTSPQTPIEVKGQRVAYYDIVERLFHWVNFVVMGVIVLSGITVFFGAQANILVTLFGTTSRSDLILLHTTFIWGLLGLIVIHLIWDDFVARGFSNIWVSGKDIRDAMTRAANFLGVSLRYPRDAKYDIFMKTYHWGLTISLVILGITGLYFMNPYGLIPPLTYGIEYLFRILHDMFAFLLVGLIIGHVYFAVLPVNWQILKAMITGTASTDFYVKHFDAARWKPKQILEVEPKEAP